MHTPPPANQDDTRDLADFSSSGDDNNSPSQNFTDDTNISSDNISSNNIDSFDDFDEDLDFSEVDDWLFESDFEPFIGAKAYQDGYIGIDYGGDLCNYYCTTSKTCCQTGP